MFVVIFRATILELDDEYSAMAEKLRKLALNHYNCLDFQAICEDGQEMSVSYWQNEDDIKLWKLATDHMLAQQKAKKQWYSSYKIDIAEINRSYHSK
ncbi:MAG: antibiotic biosynthesis monooxygenase [Kangiellaceae bacterium]|jgi:hypothetical protein|nr:antibiotic biosynthesis monooxygenase [Kangiellaceae bacterium]